MKRTNRGRLVALTLLVVATCASVLASQEPAHASTCSAANLRWAASSNRLYISGQVTCTLTEIKQIRPLTPLDLVDPAGAVWLLRTNIYLEGGATLDLHGPSVGGDVAELRLQSNNVGIDGAFVKILGDYGNVDVVATKVRSWNLATAAPDTEYATYGRAYIGVRLRLIAGVARESTLNVIDSDVGYLGYDAAESYGLVWKVSGTPGPFDTVDVHGDILRSDIHHNYFGVYTYGAFGMTMADNHVHDNVKYGLDPHDDSDSLVIEDNDVHDNGNHGIICSQRCDHITIRRNRSSDNTGNGIMIHRGVIDSVIEDNIANGNSDSGIAVFDSDTNVITGNEARFNTKAGIRFSVGAASNTVTGNVLSDNAGYGIYVYKGSDPPTSDDGRPRNNLFADNEISYNGSDAVKLADGDDNVIRDNTIISPGKTIRFDRAMGNVLADNVLDVGKVVTNGALSTPGHTEIRGLSTPVKVELQGTATSSVTDPGGAVWDGDEAPLATTVEAPSSSSLELTRALIGTSTIVTPRPLHVTADAGSVLVNPGTWGAARVWTATPSVATTVSYSLGGLEPDAAYLVRRDAATIATLVADAAGNVTFIDEAPAGATSTYTIGPP